MKRRNWEKWRQYQKKQKNRSIIYFIKSLCGKKKGTVEKSEVEKKVEEKPSPFEEKKEDQKM